MKKQGLMGMIFLAAVGFISAAGHEEESDFLSMEYKSLEELAVDSHVSFVMWGGSPAINSWVDNYAGSYLKETYNITLDRVSINDAAEYVNKLATEKLAGTKKGTADLIWINGENFKNAREAGLLYGPYTEKLPNFNNYADKKASLNDFGYRTDGFEAPYGKAQFVYEYDSDYLDRPPLNFSELKEWVMLNPGRFTYPQPPDFTGSAFIRQALYELTGGYEQYLEGYDGININRELFDEKAPLLWAYLNEIEPFLWQKGKSYPKTITVQETLFSRGELAFSMFYSPSHATNKIHEGQYKESVRTFVMEKNSITNTHFTAIPFNAPNKAGALVVTNFLLSPQAQLSKADPSLWGDLPIVDYSLLTAQEKRSFDDLDLGVATLPIGVLGPNGVPEIPSPYVELLEKGWTENVLNR